MTVEVIETPAGVVEVSIAGPPGPTGPAGVGAEWLQGSGVPGSGIGNDGDFYLNTATGDIYGPKADGAWGASIFNIAEGQQGPAGADAVYSDAIPAALAGSASAGVANEASRSDHVHPFPTPGDMGAATSAQGSLADSAVQPGDALTGLSSGAATDGQVATADGLGGIAWETPAPGSGSTDLSYTASTRLLESSSGADVTLPLANGTNAGLLAAADYLKLVGIESGAEVNVQSDWDAVSGDALILNKPTLGTAAAAATTDFAPATEGVTNGNSHDHSGGDGAQIAYASLSGLPSLGGAAALNVGTTAGTVAAGDDARFAADLSYTAATRVLASSTGTDATLPLFTSSDAGLAPASGGGTSNYLRADGTWAAPGGGWSGTTALDATVNGAASTPALKFSGTWFTGGTATTTKPQLLIEPAGTTSTAWSTAGTGLGVNAPSGFTGNLLDLQVNGTSAVRVGSDGVFYFPTTVAINAQDRCLINNTGFLTTSNRGFGFSNSTSSAAVPDTGINRVSAGVLRVVDGTPLGGTTPGQLNLARLLFSAGTTVAALPATPGLGTLARVTDASAPSVGSTVSGGGAAAALVWYNGTNWTVIGV